MVFAASQVLLEPAFWETSHPTRDVAALPGGRVRPRSGWKKDPRSGTLSLPGTPGRRPVDKVIEGKLSSLSTSAYENGFPLTQFIECQSLHY